MLSSCFRLWKYPNLVTKTEAWRTENLTWASNIWPPLSDRIEAKRQAQRRTFAHQQPIMATDQRSIGKEKGGDDRGSDSGGEESSAKGREGGTCTRGKRFSPTKRDAGPFGGRRNGLGKEAGGFHFITDHEPRSCRVDQPGPVGRMRPSQSSSRYLKFGPIRNTECKTRPVFDQILVELYSY